MKNSFRQFLCALVMTGAASAATAQAEIPILGALIPADVAGGGLPGLDALSGLGGAGAGVDLLPGIPVVSALLNGAALEGGLPVLQTILSPEFLTDPTPVLLLLSPEAIEGGSIVVMAILGGVTSGLPGGTLPGL